ncbi:MAG: fructosamine kinase family protein [Xanthomonadales bacterium]|nr:fructosamine kinase family protein [Xanthomonadales bacterium]
MQSLGPAIASQLGLDGDSSHCRRVAGGDINQAMELRFGNQRFFVKYHPGGDPAMFETEAAALKEIAATGTVRVPQPVLNGELDGTPYCVLEWLDLDAKSPRSDAALGQQLARLHQQPQPYFGWTRDNFIGSTPQPNAREDSWLTFFRDQRIGHQLDLLGSRGAPRSLLRSGRRLMDDMDRFLGDYRPVPALLHGDLWGGNYAALSDGDAAMFDPASYYGCREADLAMTRLFGGFGGDFYRAYEEQYPLERGSQQRLPLYQLYHVLNHANLFGGGYLGQSQRLLDRLNGT